MRSWATRLVGDTDLNGAIFTLCTIPKSADELAQPPVMVAMKMMAVAVMIGILLVPGWSSPTPRWCRRLGVAVVAGMPPAARPVAEAVVGRMRLRTVSLPFVAALWLLAWSLYRFFLRTAFC